MKEVRVAATLVLSIAALVMASGVACSRKSDSPSTGQQASTQSAATSALPMGRKKVTKDECDAWVGHGVDVIIADWKAAASECPANKRDALAARLDGERRKLRDAALELCVSHAGEEYPAADGACYLAASSVQTLLACKLAPMTHPEDDDLIGALEAVRKSCGSNAAPL